MDKDAQKDPSKIFQEKGSNLLEKMTLESNAGNHEESLKLGDDFIKLTEDRLEEINNKYKK